MGARSTAVEELDLDPFSPEFLADPYPGHEEMREAGPVVRLPRYDVWATARYAEVRSVLGDPETYCSSAGVGLSDFTREKPWRPPSLLLEADPPEHTEARDVITTVLSPKNVRALRDAFQAEAEAMIDRLLQRPDIDGVSDLGAAFPLKVFPDAVGLPAGGRENLLPYGKMVFNGFGPRNEFFDRAMAGGEQVRDWIMAHCERDALAADGLGAQIHEVAAENGFTEQERGMLVRSFLSAGVDTTVHALGNALWVLAQHPEQWAEMRAEPTKKAVAAFEETVRFESPVQTFFRTTTADAELGGVAIPAGEKVLTFLGAANRDPRQWDDPDRFDLNRRAHGHVGFGSGTHTCVGQMVARLEGEVLLSSMADRVESIELTGEPERQLNNTLRGLDTLPLRLHPA